MVHVSYTGTFTTVLQVIQQIIMQEVIPLQSNTGLC